MDEPQNVDEPVVKSTNDVDLTNNGTERVIEPPDGGHMLEQPDPELVLEESPKPELTSDLAAQPNPIPQPSAQNPTQTPVTGPLPPSESTFGQPSSNVSSFDVVPPSPVSEDKTDSSFGPNPTETAQTPPVLGSSAPLGDAQSQIDPTTTATKTGMLGKIKGWIFKNKLIFIIIVVSVGVLTFGGTAFAFTSWYENPQKVITDAFVNAFTAKTSIYTGNVDISNKDTKIGVSVTEKSNAPAGSLDLGLNAEFSGRKVSAKGSAMLVDTGEIYFKLDDLKKSVAEAEDTAQKQVGLTLDNATKTAIDEVAAKIDGQWVKISNDDIKNFSPEFYKSKTCMADTVKKYKNDEKAIGEIASVYQKNGFVVLQKDLGNFGYQITVKNSKYVAFLNGLKETTIYKALHECDKSFTIDTSDMSTKDEKPNNDVTYKIWVDPWSHNLSKIEVASQGGGWTSTSTMTPKFNEDLKITAPAKSMPLSDFQSYINQMMAPIAEMQAQAYKPQSNASMALNYAEIYMADNGSYPATTAILNKDLSSYSINVVSNPMQLTSANATTAVSWSCMTSCSNNTTGGRIGYYDVASKQVKYMYAGDASESSTFVNPAS